MTAIDMDDSGGSDVDGDCIDGDDDELLFADESDDGDESGAASSSGRSVVSTGVRVRPWKIMIVDDDREVHAVTKVVLGDFVFDGRPVEFVNAYSAVDACKAFTEHPDTAVVLLDVVMETDDAGLRCVEFIRKTMENKQVRIILRTGQPGQAPERQVIVDYDINDYKAKSELTAQKLFTSVVAALRSYQHIVSIDLSRRGLEKIIDGSASLFEQQSMSQFVEGVLMQLHSLIQGATGSLLCTVGSHGDSGDTGAGGSSGFSPVPSPSAPNRDGRWMRSCPPMRWMISARHSGKAATFIAATTV
jgi:CheY-like chemotaxis protein